MTGFSVFVRSFIILGGTVALALAARRASASTRYVVWQSGVIASLVLLLAFILLPRLTLPVLSGSANPVDTPAASTFSTPDPIDNLRSPNSKSNRSESIQSPVEESKAAPTSVMPSASPQTFPWFTFIWFAGVIVCVARTVQGFLQVRDLRRRTTRVNDESWLQLLESAKTSAKCGAVLELRISSDSVPPMTWGHFRHTLLLPSIATAWSPDRLRLVIAHELEHVKRGDGLSQFIGQIACAICWPNPLIWYVANQMKIERERACDDAVLRRGESAEEYADHLLEIARGINSAVVVPALSMADRGHLESRIRLILDDSRNRRVPSRVSTSTLLLGTAILSTLLATTTLTTFVMAAPARPPAPMVPILEAVKSIASPRLTPVSTQRSRPSTSTAVLVGVEFIRIAPGSFLMGCSKGDTDCRNDELPSHRVRITRAFEIGKYEVTQSQWQTIMGSNPSSSVGPDLPVETVTWDDVQSFLAKLNDRYDGYRYRLPTEAEWEYAARAGSAEPVPAPLDSIAWYANNAGQTPLDSVVLWHTDHGNYGRRMAANGNKSHNVGEKQSNAWGVFDVIGNVQELVQDWYDAAYYQQSPASDPKGPATGDQHVARGGWYMSSGLNSESTARVSARTMSLGPSSIKPNGPTDPARQTALAAAVKSKDKAAIDAALTEPERAVMKKNKLTPLEMVNALIDTPYGVRTIGLRVARDRS